MSQFYQGVTSGALPPSVPTSFVTDDATVATPAANILNVFTPGNGTQGIATSASGNTITITLQAQTTGTGTTIGATTADLITVSPTDLKSFSIQCLIAGYDLVNDQMFGGELLGTGRKNGTVTIVGGPDKTKGADAGLAAGDYDLVASGANFIVRVTGVAGRTIAWQARLVYITSP